MEFVACPVKRMCYCSVTCTDCLFVYWLGMSLLLDDDWQPQKDM